MSETISHGAKMVGGSNSTISASGTLPSPSDITSSSLYAISYDTEEPRPKVKYVKVKPKRIVIVCRCGGKLKCKSGMTRGWQTFWDNQCPKCHRIYQMKERAGDIVYE